jgi:hypothetical protein
MEMVADISFIIALISGIAISLIAIRELYYQDGKFSLSVAKWLLIIYCLAHVFMTLTLLF